MAEPDRIFGIIILVSCCTEPTWSLFCGTFVELSQVTGLMSVTITCPRVTVTSFSRMPHFCISFMLLYIRTRAEIALGVTATASKWDVRGSSENGCGDVGGGGCSPGNTLVNYRRP